jgi:hypothetical protein
LSKHKFFIDLHKGAGEIKTKISAVHALALSSKAGWYISETKSNFLIAALTLTVNFCGFGLAHISCVYSTVSVEFAPWPLEFDDHNLAFSKAAV